MLQKLKQTSKRKMFDYYSSASFVDQILTKLEQSVQTLPAPKKTIDCKETTAESGCDKLVLKCTRSNLDKCKWRVSSPTKVEVNKSIITLDDIFNPMNQSSREKLRKIKQEELDEVLGLCRPGNSCEPEIKSKAELSKPTKNTPCLSSYKRSFREYLTKMAGFEKFRSNKRRKQKKIEFNCKKINETIICSNSIPKNSIVVTTKNSTTLKRKLKHNNFPVRKSIKSSKKDDVKLPFKKRRLDKEKNKLNKKK